MHQFDGELTWPITSVIVLRSRRLATNVAYATMMNLPIATDTRKASQMICRARRQILPVVESLTSRFITHMGVKLSNAIIWPTISPL